MGVELASESDLYRRIDARRSLEGLRQRIRCKRCRKIIPESRRCDAVYCSQECHNNYHWEQRGLLRTEIRHAIHALKAPAYCVCGAVLNNRPGRPGKIAWSCKHCRDRKAQRQLSQRRRSQSLCTEQE